MNCVRLLANSIVGLSVMVSLPVGCGVTAPPASVPAYLSDTQVFDVIARLLSAPVSQRRVEKATGVSIGEAPPMTGLIGHGPGTLETVQMREGYMRTPAMVILGIDQRQCISLGSVEARYPGLTPLDRPGEGPDGLIRAAVEGPSGRLMVFHDDANCARRFVLTPLAS